MQSGREEVNGPTSSRGKEACADWWLYLCDRGRRVEVTLKQVLALLIVSAKIQRAGRIVKKSPCPRQRCRKRRWLTRASSREWHRNSNPASRRTFHSSSWSQYALAPSDVKRAVASFCMRLWPTISASDGRAPHPCDNSVLVNRLNRRGQPALSLAGWSARPFGRGPASRGGVVVAAKDVGARLWIAGFLHRVAAALEELMLQAALEELMRQVSSGIEICFVIYVACFGRRVEAVLEELMLFKPLCVVFRIWTFLHRRACPLRPACWSATPRGSGQLACASYWQEPPVDARGRAEQMERGRWIAKLHEHSVCANLPLAVIATGMQGPESVWEGIGQRASCPYAEKPH